MNNSDVQFISRLRWRCRRGMRELDLLLTRYLSDHYPQASAEEQLAFEQLLELPDPELFSYVIGKDRIPNPHWVQIFDKARIQQ